MSQQPEKTREDSFRDARKQIVRSAFLALAALGVIVFACYAWFVSSGTVTGKISSVLLNGSTFELASVGKNGAFYNDMRSELKHDDAETWSYNNLSGIKTGKYDTVVWKLTENSNMGNLTEAGIQPGTGGDISFYVIPKVGGDLTLKFHIDLIPLKLPSKNTENETAQSEAVPVENPVLEQLLKGHFLFYWYNKGTKTWVPCSTGDFTMTFTGCQVDEAIPVTLTWKWPLLLQHITDETEISNEIPKYKQYFFYADAEMGESIPNDIDLKENYQQLSKLFNNADQYIGINMNWLEVRLSAQAAS